ncbi:MAG: RidA family protein [Candidatus Rokubacteria bacterium]|nr:RidA family protein [Candidatus Rokubacteria bacterium]
MIKRINPGSRMSAAVLHDNTVYVAGQVSADAQDVKGQTELILKKIDSLLAAAGSSKSKLLSATVYLADIKTYEQMNAVWDAWVDPANSPARATVETRLAAPKYLVEITVIAAV